MDLDKLKAIGKEIERDLIKIRESVGAPIDEYEPYIEITGAELIDLATRHPGEPIIIGDKFYTAYIKDNYHHNILSHNEEINNPANTSRCFVSGKKVHFYYCSTLIYMARRGRDDRYRAPHKTQNTQIIDLSDKKDLETRLAWCKNCIKTLYNKENPRVRYNLGEVARNGDAKELMNRVKAHYFSAQKMKKFVGKLKDDTLPTGYPDNWKKISNAFRQFRNYTCESCDVNCSELPGLTDAHHKNGDKNNCDYENLECLCKYHHAELHPHYKKAMEEDYPEIMRKLQKLWKEQNISPDKYDFYRDIDDHSKTPETETPTTKHIFHRDGDNHSRTSGTETPATEHNFHHDKGNHNKEIKSHTNNCNIAILGGIMHFYYCRTMIARSEQGYKDTYQTISKIDNALIMELKNKENLGARLTWCKSCLTVLCQNGKRPRGGYVLNQMAKYGDAEELMACVEAHANNDPSATEKIQNFIKKYHAEIT